MAPGIHPPCTPTSSCQPHPRCHPKPPECEFPEECLRNTTLLNIPPCRSAASIMATRSKSRCVACGKYGTPRPRANDINDPRRVIYIHNYLRRKDHEMALQRHDEVSGQHLFTDYLRSRGRIRAYEDCCAGHGHRGRLMKRQYGKIARDKKWERNRRRAAWSRSRNNKMCLDPYGNPKEKAGCVRRYPHPTWPAPYRRRCVIL